MKRDACASRHCACMHLYIFMQELFDSDIRSIGSVSVIRNVNSSAWVNIFTNAINEKRA